MPSAQALVAAMLAALLLAAQPAHSQDVSAWQGGLSSSRPARPTPAAVSKVRSRCSSTEVLTIKWTLYMSISSTNNFTVPCGTTLRFDWKGEMHGVALVPGFRCPKPSKFQVIPGGTASPITTVAEYKTTRPGKLFFACQVYGHCQAGQIIQVRVTPTL